jgi:Mrp family chromosome partitioning ATPase
VLSLLGGLAIGIGAAMVLDMMSPPRLANAGEAVSATGLPVLARVPGLPPWARAGSPLRFRPAASAALRSLQHQLALEETAPRRLLFAGGSPGDGVTTTVAELGYTLARGGHSVLLVDLDPRGGGLAARLGVPEPAPLPDVLGRGQRWGHHRVQIGVAEATAVAGVPDAPGLHLLTMGAQGPLGIPDDLASALPDVLAEAAETTFDYVLVDAPPPAESPHALQIADAVEGVLLVLRPGRTRLTDVETALGTLSRAGRRPFGLVIVGGRGPTPLPDPAPAARRPGNAPSPETRAQPAET